MQKELGSGFKVLVDGVNGRTTVWGDPIEGCGKDQIVPSMDAAAPIDLLIISVGTNDLNVRLCVSVQDIANGAALLVRKALAQAGAFTGGKPKVILVGPPPLGPVSNGIFKDMFAGNEEKSKQLGPQYRMVAHSLGVDYLDAGTIIKSSDLDGVHLDADQHGLLGKAMASAVKKAIG
jgi:lysophospholipase L1-like esterase